MKKIISTFLCIALALFTMSSSVEAAKKDTKAPTITKSNPVNNGTDVMIDGTIVIRFSETILKGKNIAKITIKENEAKAVSYTYEIKDKFLELKPKAALKYNTYYTVTIPAAAVKDKAGNSFVKTYTFDFFTEKDPAKAKETKQTGGFKYIIELEAIFDQELTDVNVAYFAKMLEQFGINASFKNYYKAEQK